MKLERNGIVAVTFVVTFVILLLFSLLTSGFRIDIKGIFVAIYFAVWIAAVAFVLLTFIIPFLKEKKEASKAKKPGSVIGGGAIPTPFKSSRSGLPVRERIASYVTERRREDGLPAPEPLRPSRTGTSGQGGVRPSSRSVVAAGPVSGVGDISSSGSMAAGDDNLGDIPLPDDFGSVDDSSGDIGSLPGLDDDLGDLGGFGGSDDMPPDFNGDSGLPPGEPPGVRVPASSSSMDGLPDGGLPGFDGDIDADFGESDLMPDDGMMDLTGDDVLTMDDDSGLSDSSSGGLSEAGLPDLDENLEPDILDSDLSVDDDFGDIEFIDLEPEEPKKSKK